MRRAVYAALLVILAGVAGCVGDDEGAPAADPDQAAEESQADTSEPANAGDAEADPEGSSSENATESSGSEETSQPPVARASAGAAEGTEALVVEGDTLAADGESGCAETDCQRIPIEVSLPDGYWATREGGLEVSVRSQPGTWFTVDLQDASGATVAESQWARYAGTLVYEEPEPGNYTAEVEIRHGESDFDAVLQIDARPAPGDPERDLLPNIVTMPPLDLAVERPYGLPDGPVGHGCKPYEIVEDQPTKCLRLTNTLANLGHGPVEVRLTFEEGAEAVAGEGEFVQRIYRADGSHRDEVAANAEFHATHGHWHYEDFAVFELYRYDPDTGERGEQVSEAHKSGFCFFDMGLAETDHLGTTPPRFADEASCFTRPEDDWVTGLSPGWYDMYWSSLDDQYIDISGLEDGVYELVTRADAQQNLVQTTREDDAAGAIFELRGDEVEVRERWSDGTDTWTDR